MAKIKVDFSAKKIWVSTSFHKRAMTGNSTEYYELQSACEKHPGFSVAIRPFNKNAYQQHYKGLTYDYMRWYIRTYDSENTDNMLKILEKMIDISKCQSMGYRYPVIKAWFLEKYPEIAKFGILVTESDQEEVDTNLDQVVNL